MAKLNTSINNILTIYLTTQEDDRRPVYISGNFNNWHTMDANFKMTRIQKGAYFYKFPAEFIFPDELLYKFTKGDWSAVEIDFQGNRTPNRSTNLRAGVQHEEVAKWRKNWLPFHPMYLPKIEIIEEDFYIPQLNKFRKIWALLPYNYYQYPEKRFPVLYLNDAQNLFNENARFGNWEIDKKLAVMAGYDIGDIIIIALEHGEEDRAKEYIVGNTVLGHGDGKAYIRFIVDTLKPYIDNRFRTLPDRKNNGIGGSSLGGLISFYASLIAPHVFSKYMIFSPSFWVRSDVVIKPEWMSNEDSKTRFYLYAGGKESKRMIPDLEIIQHKLQSTEAYFSKKLLINTSILKSGTHNERFWSDEFPKAVEWLFFSKKAI